MGSQTSVSLVSEYDSLDDISTEKSLFKITQEGMILINEFRTDIDWIELYNPGNSSVALSSFTLSSITASVSLSGTIDADGYQQVNLALLEEGDKITLETLGITVDSVSFGNIGSAPQPIATASTARVNTTGDTAHDWNIDMTPTPLGLNDASFTDLGSSAVYFTEIYVNNSSGFIELKNRGSTEVNISNWKIVADDIYTIPLDTSLSGNGHWVLDVADYPAGMGIDRLSDNIYLYDSNWVRLDQLGWNNATNEYQDYSWNRLEGDAYNPIAFNGYSNSTSKLAPCTPTKGINNIEIVIPSTSSHFCTFFPAKINIDSPVNLTLEFQVLGGQGGITQIFGLSWLFRFDEWFEIQNLDRPTASVNHTHPGQEILYVGESKPEYYFPNITSSISQYEKIRVTWTFEINASEVIRLGLTKLHSYDIFVELYAGGTFLANETGNFMTLDFVSPNLSAKGPSPVIQYLYDRPMVKGTLAAIRELILDEGQEKDFYVRITNDDSADSDGTLLIENLTVRIEIPPELEGIIEITEGDLSKSYGNIEINQQVYYNFSLRGIKNGEGTMYIYFDSDNDFLKRAHPRLIITVTVYPLWNPFHWDNPTAPIFWVIFISIPVIIFSGYILVRRSRKRKLLSSG